LRFPFDRELIDYLKKTLQEIRDETGERNPGGWLPTEKAWFVESLAWPLVRRRLIEAGHAIDESAANNGGQSASGPSCPRPGPPVDWAAIVRQWYRGLCRDFHPDRGGDTKIMQALNEAHRRLQDLLKAS
jgi:hypothetical protein